VVATVSEDFLTKKAGPLPVYAWAGIGLGAAWLYSKYKAGKAASTAAAASSTSGTTSAAAEPSTGAPYYVIENNLPATGGTGTPVTTGTTTTTTPPGTTPQPPTTPTSPVLGGGNPPQRPGGPVAAPPTGHPVGAPVPPSGPTKPTAPAAPAAQKYTVQHGDTLWGIAQKFTGNGANYTSIWTYNMNAAVRKAAGLPPVQGTNPNLIYPGEVFLIPPKS